MGQLFFSKNYQSHEKPYLSFHEFLDARTLDPEKAHVHQVHTSSPGVELYLSRSRLFASLISALESAHFYEGPLTFVSMRTRHSGQVGLSTSPVSRFLRRTGLSQLFGLLGTWTSEHHLHITQ